jgi:hypothetical protein
MANELPQLERFFERNDIAKDSHSYDFLIHNSCWRRWLARMDAPYATC